MKISNNLSLSVIDNHNILYRQCWLFLSIFIFVILSIDCSIGGEAIKENPAHVLKKYLDESEDPVELAAEVVTKNGRGAVFTDDNICFKIAIYRLFKYWEDPRSEQALSIAAKSGKQIIPQIGLTKYGIAQDILNHVKAKKQVSDLINNITNHRESLKVIEEYITNNWDSLITNSEGRYALIDYPYTLCKYLIQKAAEVGGADALSIIYKTEIWPGINHVHGDRETSLDEYFWYQLKYGQEIVDYAKSIGFEKAAKSHGFLDSIARTKNVNAGRLLSEWLKGVREDDYKSIDVIISKISMLPDAREQLLLLLDNPNFYIFRISTHSLMSIDLVSDEVIEKFKKVKEQIVSRGADEDKVRILDSMLARLTDNLQLKKERPNKK